MVRSSYINIVKISQNEREIVKNGLQTVETQVVLMKMKIVGYVKRFVQLPRKLTSEREDT